MSRLGFMLLDSIETILQLYGYGCGDNYNPLYRSRSTAVEIIITCAIANAISYACGP